MGKGKRKKGSSNNETGGRMTFRCSPCSHNPQLWNNGRTFPKILGNHKGEGKNEMVFQPIGEFIKIHTNGACGEDGTGSFGGLARSYIGEWIEGFAGYLGSTTLLDAELKGIYNGLMLAKERNWAGVYIYSDSHEGITLLNQREVPDNHLHAPVARDCKVLITELEVTLKWTPRTANRCADYIAKTSHLHKEPKVSIMTPPAIICEDLEHDCKGAEFGHVD